jgi:protein involved in temperature-dependent protein secretion
MIVGKSAWRKAMHGRASIGLAVAIALGVFTTAAMAASADVFKAAYAKAEAAEKNAGALKNQWTTTEAELKAAQAAANSGNYDEAVKHAEAAEALANASIAQAKEQATAWTEAVIR